MNESGFEEKALMADCCSRLGLEMSEKKGAVHLQPSGYGFEVERSLPR